MDTPNNVEQVHSIDQVPSVTQPVSPPTTSPDSGTNLGAPAPGPGMSKKALIIILISAFVLAGISYGGIWYWQNQQVAQEVAPTFTPQPSVSATLDATADWKTYTNTQYGFEFKYPDNRFSILASGSSVFLITPTSQEKVLRVSSIPHAPDENYYSTQIVAGTYDGLTGYYFCNPAESDCHGTEKELIQIRNPNKERDILVVSKYFDQDTTGQYLPVLNQILSTFKFTDSATVTKKGYLMCLSLKPATPIQYCETGFKDIDGNGYILTGDINDINAKMNQFQNTKLVTISGKLTSDTNGFDAVGTIVVSSFTY